jgi:hypothetical protein
MMAVQGISGLSVDKGFQEEVASNTELLPKLFNLILDPSLVIEHEAWKALVNLAQHAIISATMSNKFAIIVAGYICNCAGLTDLIKLDGASANFSPEQLIFSDLACMLLSNLSKNIACAESLLPFTGLFIEIVTSPKQKFDFLFSVLADMTLTSECRRYLSEGDQPTFLRLLTFINDSSYVKRGGIAVIVKNCLLEVDRHQVLLEDHDDTLLAALLGRLVHPECVFSDEELDKMLLEISLEHRNTPAEVDPAIREMIVESLIALGTTYEGRVILREKEVYPIIRECHRLETEDNIRGGMEIVVEYIIRDEEHGNIRPTKFKKIVNPEIIEDDEVAPIESLI